MGKKKKKHPPELQVYEESLAGGTIAIQQVEPDSAKWKVIAFQGLNLWKLAKALYKILKNKNECYTIYIGNVRLTKALTKEEVLQELANGIGEEELRNIFLSK